jgi:hypothetical protein
VSPSPVCAQAPVTVTGCCSSGPRHREVIVFLLAFPDVMVYLNGLFRQKP